MVDFSVSILAGGKSSRMGEDKGLMSLFGKPMIQYVIDEARTLNRPIQIISNNSNYNKFDLPVFKDNFEEKGPLSGIYSALLNSDKKYNLIICCDVPYAKAALFKYILSKCEGYEVTLPSKDNRIHPLIGVYQKSLLPHFENEIRNSRLKVLDAVQDLNGQIVDAGNFEKINFKNLNSKSDLEV
jgi:molybdopterin-guanine dinucleotide biosynthesis protein A